MADQRSPKSPGAPAPETDRGKKGRVWLLGAGPGDPDLITYRGVLLLGQAEVVLHDALSHPELLDLCPQAEIVDVGKRYGKRATPQSEITEQLLAYARSGKRVVRLKGGDPILFARGSEEALALAEAGIPFEIVPGVTSAVAASGFAGIPLTHRDASSSVTFITGSDREGKEWSPDAWKKLATATGTICVYMGMRRIEAITQAVIDGGRDPETPAAVIRWGARPNQRTVTGTLRTIAEKARAAELSSPAIIVIGEVVSMREQLRWYDNRPLFGKKVLVARPPHQGSETARALRARAAQPLVVPAIEILPPPDPARLKAAVAAASTYDWVLFTSANGVAEFFRAADELGKDARLFGAARVGVIGPKTGDALLARSIRPDLTARRFVAEELVAELLKVEPRPRRVLLPRALSAREVIPEELGKVGIAVDVVPAYETRPAQGKNAEELRRVVAEEADAILLTSSSMVDSIADALGDKAPELLGRCTVACIGPITAETARSRGIVVDVEAQVFTIEGALDALEAHFSG
jgi:uroporphyrinogen III methyltransferase/synthase